MKSNSIHKKDTLQQFATTMINPNISDNSKIKFNEYKQSSPSRKNKCNLLYESEHTINGRLYMETGFTFEYSEFPEVQVIVSNCHIAENSDAGGFVFNLVDKNDDIVFSEKLPFGADRFSRRWYYHSNRSE
jgi:hypothetical protein